MSKIFKNKRVKLVSFGLSTALLAGNTGLVISHANEKEVNTTNKKISVEEINNTKETIDSKVNISNFDVMLDGDKRVNIEFTIDKEIDLGIFTKDDILIKLTNKKNGFSKLKMKTWDGYLNGTNNSKYGLKNPKVPAGTYSTVFQYEELKGLDLKDLKVELTVKNDGIATTEVFEIIEKEVQITNADYTIANQNTHGKDAIIVKFTIDKDIDLSKYKIGVASETKEKDTEMLLNNFLVNEETKEEYGLSGIIPSGTYLTDFTLDEIDTNDSIEKFNIKIINKETNEVTSEQSFIAQHPFAETTNEGLGPDGDVMPQIDNPASEGLGPDGDVMPQIDSPASEGLGPDGDITPELDSEELDGNENPQTGDVSVFGYFGMGIVAISGLVLSRRSKNNN